MGSCNYLNYKRQLLTKCYCCLKVSILTGQFKCRKIFRIRQQSDIEYEYLSGWLSVVLRHRVKCKKQTASLLFTADGENLTLTPWSPCREKQTEVNDLLYDKATIINIYV